MSANNYRECPKCRKIADEERAKRMQTLEESYGKVHAAEYARLLKIAYEPIEIGQTLEEYYDIRLGDSKVLKCYAFTVNYSAGCRKCGYEFQFNHNQEVEVQ